MTRQCLVINAKDAKMLEVSSNVKCFGCACSLKFTCYELLTIHPILDVTETRSSSAKSEVINVHIPRINYIISV